jgi:hypothetical protein
MRRVSQIHKTPVISVNHTNFIRLIRADPIRARVAEAVASTSIEVAQDVGHECVQSQGNDPDSDNASDSGFFDCDLDAKSGDDDLIVDNVDT